MSGTSLNASVTYTGLSQRVQEKSPNWSEARTGGCPYPVLGKYTKAGTHYSGASYYPALSTMLLGGTMKPTKVQPWRDGSLVCSDLSAMALWKSGNGGASWRITYTPGAYLGDIIYSNVGTDKFYLCDATSVWQSDDDALKSWTQVKVTGNTGVFGEYTYSGTPRLYYGDAAGGLYYYDGASWTDVASPPGGGRPFTSIVQHGTALFVATDQGNVYTSADGETSWSLDVALSTSSLLCVSGTTLYATYYASYPKVTYRRDSIPTWSGTAITSAGFTALTGIASLDSMLFVVVTKASTSETRLSRTPYLTNDWVNTFAFLSGMTLSSVGSNLWICDSTNGSLYKLNHAIY